VLGLFVRRCRVEYAKLPFDHLLDVHKAYHQYIHGLAGDAEFTTGNDPKAEEWLSEYNVKEFLKYQAEKIERIGTANINPTVLHSYLEKIEKQLPSMSIVRHVRYLNYTRTKEYIHSLYHLHHSFDMSLNKGL
jgi:hypothetical protein